MFATEQQIRFLLKNVGLPRSLGHTTCFVTEPGGSVSQATEPPGAVQFDRGIYLTYPEDFRGSIRNPTSGIYRVRWETRLQPSDSPTVLDDAALTVSLPQSVARAELVVRFSQSAPYRAEIRRQQLRYSLGILDNGRSAADNVEVSWLAIDSRPLAETFLPDFPYRSRPVDPEMVGKTLILNPGHEEFFQLFSFWMSSESRLIVAGLDTKRGHRNGSYSEIDGCFHMDEGEAWRLEYQVTCANAAPLRVVFLAVRNGNDVVLSRES
jgi:hypothetical protein